MAHGAAGGMPATILGMRQQSADFSLKSGSSAVEASPAVAATAA